MRKDKLFFGALALVTFGPMLGLPFIVALTGDPNIGLGSSVAQVSLCLGTAHIASTIFYYLDPEYRPLIRADAKRFMLPALALPLTFLVILLICPVASILLFVPFFAWQMYHVGRQSYGIVALGGASTGFGKTPTSISWAMNFAAIAAAAGSLSVSRWYPIGLDPRIVLRPQIISALHAVAIANFAAAVALFLATLVQSPGFRRNLRMSVFSAGGIGMFFGLAFLPSAGTALTCGFSHAAQYLLITLMVARRAKIGGWLLACGAMATVAVTFIFLRLYQSPGGYQIFLGLFATHFLADAKLWRLRESFQRGMVRDRLPFLFLHREVGRQDLRGAVGVEGGCGAASGGLDRLHVV